MKIGLLWVVLGTIALFGFGPLGLVFVVLWVPWVAYITWQHATHAGYAIDERMVANVYIAANSRAIHHMRKGPDARSATDLIGFYQGLGMNLHV